jgi:hypothetical protein
LFAYGSDRQFLKNVLRAVFLAPKLADLQQTLPNGFSAIASAFWKGLPFKELEGQQNKKRYVVFFLTLSLPLAAENDLNDFNVI